MNPLITLRRRFAGLRLASRLAWLTAGLTAVFVAATLVPLSVSTRDATREIVAGQVAQTQRALIANQERELARLEHAATLIGQSPTTLAALADDRTQALTSSARRGFNPVLVVTVRHALETELRNVGQDLIAITDADGRVFAAASTDSAAGIDTGADLSRLEAVRVALDPDVPADTGVFGVIDGGRAPYSVAAVPLVSAGRTLGVILLGERIDTAYVASARSAFSGDVVVSAGERVLASTRSDMSGAEIGSLASALAAGNAKYTVRVAGDELVGVPLPLGRNLAGAPVTLWLLQPVSASAVLTRPILLQFVLYGLAAVILAGLGAAVVAQGVLKPLEQFVGYMRRADPRRPAAPRLDLKDASPEIHALDDSFASLMESLRESEAQLRQSQKLEAIGTLAGGVAHDFNNLLTVITGYTELAMMRMPDERLQQDLTQVMEAAQRAARLTHQLLAFSRKQVLEPTLLDLSEVVEHVVPMLRRLIGEHVRIDVDAAANLPAIHADRGQLEQVIINLVVNARDAMPGGGVITVRTAAAPDGAALSVGDTGTGMSPELRERIFEPFFTTKEAGKGTGLGLSMVYGIVTQSGGTIDVDTEVGRGTVFTMRFPRAAGHDEAERAGNSAVAVPRGTETILLVEDEPELRDLARRSLESSGYTVIAPEHTTDALAIAMTRKVDLVVSDIVMPVMSGPTIVRRIAEAGATPRVLFMSGYADDTIAEYRLEEGMTVLRKPFSPSQLARAVRVALDAKP